VNLRGQEMSHLTCKMIRIDVDHPSDGKNYSVPPDNPFVGQPGIAPETWAYGFRNPWRITFDSRTGDLWVGQNGQDLWEQAYVVHRGENYGWSVNEGSHPFQPTRQRGPTPIVMPTIEHPHSEMRSLTGGIVYYGDKFPELNGVYVYGDFGTGRIFGARYEGGKVTWHRELARTTLQIVGFREDKHGDLFVLDDGGGLWKLETAPAAEAQATPFPTKLSETGLFTDTKTHTPDPGLIPYSVNAALWSDGAAKERFIALPGDSTIEVTPTRGWKFADGAVLVKTFALDLDEGNPATRKRVETRLLTRTQGQWYGYSYRWDDDQTDATLVGAAGIDKPFSIKDPAAPTGVRTQTWHYPSRAECMTCHSRAANFVLGPSTLQMNRDYDYPAPGGGVVRDNQLRTLEHLGVLRTDYAAWSGEAIRRELKRDGKQGAELDRLVERRSAQKDQRQPQPSALLPIPPAQHPAIVDPSDPKADLALRAKSYLHANCAICHVEAGGGNAQLDLEFTTPPENTRIFDATPQHDSFGIAGARIIARGDPARSVLLHRMSTRGPGQMPPLATTRVDEEAIRMLKEWVEGMGRSGEK
jgi:mono/diheme cytochrome c family protein